MKIARFVDKEWHHYCVRHSNFEPLYTDVNEFKNVKADKKFSYLIEWLPNTDTIPKLYNRIQMHMKMSDHVYVDFGEPIIAYKDKSYGWDDTNNCWEGPYFYTNDFINRFNKTGLAYIASCI